MCFLVVSDDVLGIVKAVDVITFVILGAPTMPSNKILDLARRSDVMLTFVVLSLLSFLRSKLRNLLLKPPGHHTYLGLLHQQQEQYHSTMAVKASTTFVYDMYITAYQLDPHWISY